MAFHAYIFFSDGKCKEAMTRYQEIFGGALQVMTFGEVPAGEEGMPGAEPDQVMHASITLGDGLLMGSDDPTGDGGPRKGVAISYSAPDVDTGRKALDALCEGGELQMPWEATFWSPGFGACVDRWGVPWMVDVISDQMPG